jgi:tellurite resistance-related uncharacterized protein
MTRSAIATPTPTMFRHYTSTPIIFAVSAAVIGGFALIFAQTNSNSNNTKQGTTLTTAQESATPITPTTTTTPIAYEVSGMPILPSDVVQYAQIPKQHNKPFTATTVPKGLLKQHSTRAGTWGVIRVLKGQLQYLIHQHDPSQSSVSVHVVVDAARPGIIEPTKYHQVKALTDDLEFHIEFHRRPGT